MFQISKEFHFSAAHQLDYLPEEHPCSRLHGHNYVITVHLKSPNLDQRGFVIDYRELDEFKTWIDKTLDHRNLNDIIPMAATAEFIAEWIFEQWKPIIPQLYQVDVKETEKTKATYCEN